LSLSLYEIIPIGNSKFEFITSSGRTYRIYFDHLSKIFPDERVDQYAVYFGFDCSPPFQVLNRVHDPRVGITIMSVIEDFFHVNPQNILVYVCSGLDGQDRHRQISFAKWYNASPLKADFKLAKKKFTDTYCGVIYDARHPELAIIENSFTDFDLDNKPMGVEEEEALYLWYEYALIISACLSFSASAAH